MAKANITPAMVRWARHRRGAALDDAARKLGVAPETLDAWEAGRARPSFRQALGLAHQFNIPFGYLYLREPLDEQLPLPDLRTITGAVRQKASPEFLDVLYDAMRKQDWYREYLQSEGAETLPFIGRFNGDAPSVVAADIRKTLRVDQHFGLMPSTWEEFLTQLVQKAEDARILVLRSSYAGRNTRRSLAVQEFRGFAISDPIAPLVYINSTDWKAAQIFTLAHELAHLWIGETGISNPDYRELPKNQHNTIDRYCDAIAAEVLVPENDFGLAWNPSKTVDQNIYDLVRRYRVSAFVVLRRAYNLDKVDTATYREKYDKLIASVTEKKGDGGTFYNTFFARNSPSFSATLVLAAAEGRVSPTEAATLLNIRLGTLPKVQQQVFARLVNA